MDFTDQMSERDPREVSEALGVRRHHINEMLPALRAVDFTGIPINSNKFAVFIETKRSPFTEFAIRNIMFFLGEEWGLQVFVSRDMRDWIMKVLSGWQYVHINSLPVGLQESGRDFADTVKRKVGFWKSIKGEVQLFFNSDSMLCSNEVEAFLEYDYVGAPWPDSVISPWCLFGSGGLSVRRKMAMIEVCKASNANPWIIGSEDAFYSINMHLMPDKYHLPSVELARRFAVERIYHPSPVGVHKAWQYISATELQTILSGVSYGGEIP
ncbi:MAG: hypothetical protein OEQ39_06405 [Gammaproteobacteria bacterium]|nr:hypothetical protein [Gammaproteobacteria bacterium]MDH3464360.1 hypothetical protein [Gammaproteobacteria bacterium]